MCMVADEVTDQLINVQRTRGRTMQRKFNPPGSVSHLITLEPSLRHGEFAVHTAMAFVVIILLTTHTCRSRSVSVRQ